MPGLIEVDGLSADLEVVDDVVEVIEMAEQGPPGPPGPPGPVTEFVEIDPALLAEIAANTAARHEANPNYAVFPGLDGGFDTGAGWASTGNGTVIAGGKLVFPGGGPDGGVYLSGLTPYGEVFRVTYTVVSISVGAVQLLVGLAPLIPRTQPGTYTETVRRTGDEHLRVYCTGGSDAIIDNLILEYLTGDLWGVEKLLSPLPDLIAKDLSLGGASIVTIASWLSTYFPLSDDEEYFVVAEYTIPTGSMIIRCNARATVGDYGTITSLSNSAFDSTSGATVGGGSNTSAVSALTEIRLSRLMNGFPCIRTLSVSRGSGALGSVGSGHLSVSGGVLVYDEAINSIELVSSTGAFGAGSVASVYRRKKQ